jgi:hypothetical protein
MGHHIYFTADVTVIHHLTHQSDLHVRHVLIFYFVKNLLCESCVLSKELYLPTVNSSGVLLTSQIHLSVILV